MSNCKHEKSKILDIVYPDYILAQCLYCKKEVKFSGLEITNYEENMDYSNVVIVIEDKEC